MSRRAPRRSYKASNPHTITGASLQYRQASPQAFPAIDSGMQQYDLEIKTRQSFSRRCYRSAPIVTGLLLSILGSFRTSGHLALGVVGAESAGFRNISDFRERHPAAPCEAIRTEGLQASI